MARDNKGLVMIDCVTREVKMIYENTLSGNLYGHGSILKAGDDKVITVIQNNDQG